MPTPAVSFWVPGIPRTQGSKTPGLVWTRGGKPIPTLRERGGEEWRAWRSQVRDCALMVFGDSRRALDGPVSVALRFQFVRPRGHFGTGRNADRLLEHAPAHPWGARNDLDKLARAVNDSLTSVVYRDDGQIVSTYLEKRWGATYGVQVSVYAEPEALLQLPEVRQLALL